MNRGGWSGRGGVPSNGGEMMEAQQRLDSALERSRSQMMMEGCLPRNRNQRRPWGNSNNNRGGVGRVSRFDQGRQGDFGMMDNQEESVEVSGQRGAQQSDGRGDHHGIGNKLTNMAHQDNTEFNNNPEYNLPGSYPRGGKTARNNIQRGPGHHGAPQNQGGHQGAPQNQGGHQGAPQNQGGHQGAPQNQGGHQGPPQSQGGHQGGPQSQGGRQPQERRPDGQFSQQSDEVQMKRKRRRNKYWKPEMLTVDQLPPKEGNFLYKATYFPEYIEYVENVVKKKKMLRENEFAEKMLRLNATMALESLVSSITLAGDKIRTEEQLRSHISNHMNINAFCFFVRFLDPKDTSVRVIECQLYIFHVLMAKHRVRIPRCSIIDVVEGEWLKCRECHHVMAETYVKAWYTLKSKKAETIVNTHKTLLEGQHPECAFAQIVLGMGKKGSSNLSQLLRSRHPTKPQVKGKFEDFVLIEQSRSEKQSEKFKNVHNLSYSASSCGMIVEWRYEHHQIRKVNHTTCSIFLDDEYVAEAVETTRELARLRAADVAVLKLKRTHPIIVMFPTAKDVKAWDEFVVEAETWFAENANEVNFPLLDAEIDVEVTNSLERESKAFNDDDVVRTDLEDTADPNNDQQAGEDGDNDNSTQDMDLEEGTDTEPNPYKQFFVPAKKTRTFTNTNPAVEQSNFRAPVTNSFPVMNSSTNSLTTPTPSFNPCLTSLAPPPPPPGPPPVTQNVYPTSATNYPTSDTSVSGMSSTYVAPTANTQQQNATTNNYWLYNGQYYSYDEYGYCYLADPAPQSMAGSDAWGATPAMASADLYSAGNDPYVAGTQVGASAAYGQQPSSSWAPNPQYTNPWPAQFETQVKPPTFRAITKAPPPSVSTYDVAIKEIAQKITTSENRKVALENQLKNISGKKHTAFGKTIKGRFLVDIPIEETGPYVHTKEPLLPLNKKVVLYIMHLIEQHVAKDCLEELAICADVPLAERQALELLFPKHDCKLFFMRQKDKCLLSAIRWISGQEMKATLKRHKNAIGRTVLISEGMPSTVK